MVIKVASILLINEVVQLLVFEFIGDPSIVNIIIIIFISGYQKGHKSTLNWTP